MTKRIISLMLAVLLLLSCASVAFADGDYNNEYWRINDFNDYYMLSDEELNALEDSIIKAMISSRCDYPVFYS